MSGPKKIDEVIDEIPAVQRLEYPDPTPCHIPGKTDQQKPLTLREEMRRYIREQVSQVAVQREAGSFQEEDDFDEEDDSQDLTSPYTVQELQPEAGTLENDLEGSQTPQEPLITPPEDRSEATGAEGAEDPAPSPAIRPPDLETQ